MRRAGFRKLNNHGERAEYQNPEPPNREPEGQSNRGTEGYASRGAICL